MSFGTAGPHRTSSGPARHLDCRKARLLAFVVVACGCPWLPAPAQAPFSDGPALDKAIQKAIAAHKTPGAVVLIGRPGRILYEEAYGERSIEPTHEKATVDTIYDAASLTKVIATTSAVMKLFERGQIRLNDRVTEYLPEFQGGESEITIRDLMTHFSGLRPDLDLKPEWSGYRPASAWRSRKNRARRGATGLSTAISISS